MSLLASLLLLPTLAHAETVPLEFQVPATVKMFEQVRITKATGKVKGKDCVGALAVAKDDLARVMGKNGMTDIIAIYTLNARVGWVPVTDVDCTFVGPADAPKATEVKIEALLTKAGEGAAYADITGMRATEIVDAYIGKRGAFVGAILMGTRIDEIDGALWWRDMEGDRKDTFGRSDNQNDRAVVMFREIVTPELARLGDTLARIPEVKGITVVTGCTRTNKEGKTESETWHYRLPTSAITEFLGGKITEQQLVAVGGAYIGPDLAGMNSRLTKVDVSFVQADD
ncbi:MAG: hypothetical protein Q8P18_26700 [Pseudomonadota bacterium]|nr:hypothetical protein [Pseudomonadota bacterium]